MFYRDDESPFPICFTLQHVTYVIIERTAVFLQLAKLTSLGKSSLSAYTGSRIWYILDRVYCPINNKAVFTDVSCFTVKISVVQFGTGRQMIEKSIV